MDPTCPCSEHMGESLLVLLLVFVGLLGIRFVRRKMKKTNISDEADHRSQPLFNAETQPGKDDSPDSTTAPGWWKALVVVVLVLVVVLVIVAKKSSQEPGTSTAADNPLDRALNSGKPVLADFGRGMCIPCKIMKPILDKLADELKGKVHVLILDTGDYAYLARRHRIRVIPTQIFFDDAGKEIFRHEGFMSGEDILAKWKELDVDLNSPRGSDEGDASDSAQTESKGST